MQVGGYNDRLKCSNGYDDGDCYKDCPDDPECSSPTDNDEN